MNKTKDETNYTAIAEALVASNRPKLQPLSAQLCFMVAEEEKDAVYAEGFERGISPSVLEREIIRKAIQLFKQEK